MKFLLIVIQLTIASPLMGEWQSSALEQAIEKTMMNIEDIMAALDNIEKEQMPSDSVELIIQVKTQNIQPIRQKRKNNNQRYHHVRRQCFWRICF